MIEEQTHQPFSDFMKSDVLRPLGMTSSSFDWDASLRGRTAIPYQRDGRPIPVLVPQDIAADSLFATGPDLARFLIAPLPDYRLATGPDGLGQKSRGGKSALADRLPMIELEGLKMDGPGLGCFIERLPDGRLVVTNGGYDPGWASQYYIVPSTGDGIVVLTNSEVGEPAIAEVLADWAAWRGLPPMKLTHAHYMLRLNVALVLGILVMISLHFGSDLLIEIDSGARRFGDLGPASLAGGAFETTLALSLMGLWFYLRAQIVMVMPIFYDFGSIAIGLFAFVAVARLAFPRRRNRVPAPASPSAIPLVSGAGAGISPN
jgi:hypothetical protein